MKDDFIITPTYKDNTVFNCYCNKCKKSINIIKIIPNNTLYGSNIYIEEHICNQIVVSKSNNIIYNFFKKIRMLIK